MEQRPTRQVSAVRLAMAAKAMASAETLQGVINAKDKAKAAGLTPRDTDQLKQHFETHVARIKATQAKDKHHGT